MKKSASDPGPARPPGRGERALSAKAQRARENGAYVRRLLRQRAPEFAATLAAAEHDVSCLLSSERAAGTPVPRPRRAPGQAEP